MIGFLSFFQKLNNKNAAIGMITKVCGMPSNNNIPRQNPEIINGNNFL